MCEEVFEKVKEPERRYALGMERLKAHDYAGARECFEHDADLGFGDAQYRLAMMYERGLGVEENAEESFRLLSLAAKKHNMYAQMQLGIDYLLGYGVEHDVKKSNGYFEKALKQLTVAAEAGDAEALNALGDYYGIYLAYANADDCLKAVEYWKKAAELGDAQGQFNLGCCYEEGSFGLEKDIERARLWLEKAAAQGHGGAKEQLRCLY